MSKGKIKLTQTRKLPIEGLKSHTIQVTPASTGIPHYVPVIDATDNADQRKVANTYLKADRRLKGSKYMKPSHAAYGDSYQDSYKRKDGDGK